MEDYVNLNNIIKNYDDYKEKINNDDNDLYYNDTIINYDIM